MPYAVELYFDKESNNHIRNILNFLKNNNIPLDEKTEPHISLALYNDLYDENKFLKELYDFSLNIQSFKISFSSIGIFLTEESVLFFAPVVTKNLLNIHKKYHNTFSQYNYNTIEYYKPNNWVPHCTIAMNLTESQLTNAVEKIKDIFIPFSCNIVGIGLLKFLPNKKIKEFNIAKNDNT